MGMINGLLFLPIICLAAVRDFYVRKAISGWAVSYVEELTHKTRQ